MAKAKAAEAETKVVRTRSPRMAAASRMARAMDTMDRLRGRKASLLARLEECGKDFTAAELEVAAAEEDLRIVKLDSAGEAA